MTFDPNQPSAAKSPSQNVTDIQTNFNQFASIFSSTTGAPAVTYNHVALNDFLQGYHAAVILQKQTSDPTVDTTIANVYCKDITSGLGTEPQLFVKTQETPNLPNLPLQMTLNQVNTTGPNQYQSFFVGNYLVFVGNTNNIATTITLSPATTEILTAHAVPQATLISDQPYNCGVTVTQPTQLKINSDNAPAGTTFLWFAVGVP